MANGWTNANNFKPWTQYEFTPGTEDIIIPKGSYLSQTIKVHGDSNYASCNIVQGESVGDIPYGSANTPVRNFPCGEFYSKNSSFPCGCIDIQYNQSFLSTKEATFNNHVIKCDETGVYWIFIVNSKTTINDKNAYRSEDSGATWTPIRTQLDDLTKSALDYVIINNINYWLVSGVDWIDEDPTDTVCSYSTDYGNTWEVGRYDKNVKASYFIIGCPGKTDEFPFMGIIKTVDNQIDIIQSRDCEQWTKVQTLTVSDTTQPLDMIWDKNQKCYYILMAGNLYKNGQLMNISIPESDLVTQIVLGRETDHLYAVIPNGLYDINTTTNAISVSKTLQEYLSNIATLGINHTEWITRVEYFNSVFFLIGSSETPYILEYWVEGSSIGLVSTSFASNCCWMHASSNKIYTSYRVLVQSIYESGRYHYPSKFPMLTHCDITIKGEI